MTSFTPGQRRTAGTLLSVACGLLLLCLLAAPGIAGEKFLYGSPELSAAISGTNQFTPGQEVILTVTIQNTGLNELKIVQSTIISQDDLPNTAKLVTVGLSPGTAPVTVKTDPQMIGDVSGGSSETADFTIRVADNAGAGTYQVPLQLTYTYLEEAEQYGTDTIRYYYQHKTIEIPLNISVKSDARLTVLDMKTEHLNVGTEGYLTLSLKNVGYDNAKNSVVKIARNGASPLVPTDSAVFIGDFPRDSTVQCTFKVSVSSNAEPQSYPLDVYLTYENDEGASATSETVTIGIPVGPKIDFSVISTSIAVSPGEKKVVEVQYKNVGAATAYNAQARISAVDPFTSNDDTAYLGDLEPGQTATARFDVTVDAGATEKEYGLDSEIRYRDALDNSQISDTMKITIGVVPQTGLAGTLGNPIVIAVILAVIVGLGYYVMRLRRKSGNP